jgi:hypothetical protein
MHTQNSSSPDGTVTGSAPKIRGARSDRVPSCQFCSQDGTVTGSAPKTHPDASRGAAEIAEGNAGGVLRTPIGCASPCLPSCPSCLRGETLKSFEQKAAKEAKEEHTVPMPAQKVGRALRARRLAQGKGREKSPSSERSGHLKNIQHSTSNAQRRRERRLTTKTPRHGAAFAGKLRRPRKKGTEARQRRSVPRGRGTSPPFSLAL